MHRAREWGEKKKGLSLHGLQKQRKWQTTIKSLNNTPVRDILILVNITKGGLKHKGRKLVKTETEKTPARGKKQGWQNRWKS